MMERVAKATRLINGMHFVPRGDLLLDPIQQPRTGQLLRQRDGSPLALHGRDDEVQIHIQPQLEDVAHRSVASGWRVGSVVFVMKGWVVIFHIQQRVPGRPTPGNPSWHLTARSRYCSNADALASPSLSLGR